MSDASQAHTFDALRELAKDVVRHYRDDPLSADTCEAITALGEAVAPW